MSQAMQGTGSAQKGAQWGEKYSKKNQRSYWKDPVSGTTSWSPWEEKWSKKHKRAYWKHRTTGKSDTERRE